MHTKYLTSLYPILYYEVFLIFKNFVTASSYYTVCVYHNEFNYSPITGYVSTFNFLPRQMTL